MTKHGFASPKTKIALAIIFCLFLLLIPANVSAEGDSVSDSGGSSDGSSDGGSVSGSYSDASSSGSSSADTVSTGSSGISSNDSGTTSVSSVTASDTSSDSSSGNLSSNNEASIGSNDTGSADIPAGTGGGNAAPSESVSNSTSTTVTDTAACLESGADYSSGASDSTETVEIETETASVASSEALNVENTDSAASEDFVQDESAPADDAGTADAAENVQAESDTTFAEESAEESANPEAAAPEEQPEGNSYVATIDNSAFVVGSAGTETFTVTFTEVGSDTIGSARVTVPTGEPGWTLHSVSSVEASNGHGWTATTSGNVITITADDPSQLVRFNESVAVTFDATYYGGISGNNVGVYMFLTEAWTDNVPLNGNVNNMAAGYSHPVVIVGQAVSNETELSNIRNILTGIYVQTADIDLNNAMWIPIGTDISSPSPGAFQGAFHGGGYTISNFQVGNNVENAGLFGYTNGAVLHSVWLEDFYVDAHSYNYVGAIAGHMTYHSKLINSYAAGGDVRGVDNVGGLVGRLTGSSSSIINSYADVEVAADSNAGGLVGYVQGSGTGDGRSFVVDSYAHGNVTAYNLGGVAGGLVGTLGDHSLVMRSYSTGEVSGATTGGLVGVRETLASVSGSFYDSNTSGQSDNDGRGHPWTTAELQNRSNYTSYAIPWAMVGTDGAYPLLWWQPQSGLNSSSSLWYMPGSTPVPPPTPVPHPDYGPGYYGSYCTGYSCPTYLTYHRKPDYYPYRLALPRTGGNNHLYLVVLLLITVGVSSLFAGRLVFSPENNET